MGGTCTAGLYVLSPLHLPGAAGHVEKDAEVPQAP